MQILDGKALSNQILDELKKEIAKLDKKPHLAVILVGKDEASKLYVNIKKRTCENLGLTSTIIRLPENITEQALINEIEKLNEDKDVNGILVQLPLPKQLNQNTCINKISAIKDVDGITYTNLGMIFSGETPFAYPCTPFGIINLIKKYGIELKGKHAVIVGRSLIVGKPMAQMLLNENVTVTLCHSHTVNLQEITRTADILISATGKPIITAEMVTKGTIVIDAGTFKDSKGKLIGDVDYENIKEKTSFITPVPGGVGPMTIASLMQNTLLLFKKQS